MKFVCDRCQTKYSIADDKVRGKVLKVRCKTCQNVITVREPGARPSVGSLAPIKPGAPGAPGEHPRRPTTGSLAVLGENHDELSERTAIAAVPTAFMAELAQQQPRRATPPPPPPLGDGIEWFLAISGAQQGPFTRKLLVDKLLAMPKDADVHVWNDQMDGWKPPADVPDVARDLAARKPPQVPVRPPVPRMTPSPPVPPLGARRGTQPLTSGVGAKLPASDHATKLPAPVAAAAHAHAVPAPHAHLEDPAAGQETPGPASVPVPAPRTRKPTNGVGTNGAAAPVAALGGESDALSALNLGGGAAAAVAVASSPPVAVRGTAPRLMQVSDATAWSGQERVGEGRHKSTKMVVGLLAIVAVIILIATLNFTKKSTAVPITTAKGTADSEKLRELAETVKQENGTNPPRPNVQPQGNDTGGGTRPHVRPPVRGGRVLPNRGGGGGGTIATNTQTQDTTGGAADVGRAVAPIAPVHHNRPPPSQGDISRVINNNKIGIKTCYQRALLRDSSLTHGKIVVGLTIGTSGRVRGTHVDGPMAFRALEPCIKEMVGRWTFPQADEEYGTEFAYVFQGNE
jgi:predicted Zn finger-like uncharacterized protein